MSSMKGQTRYHCPSKRSQEHKRSYIVAMQASTRFLNGELHIQILHICLILFQTQYQFCYDAVAAFVESFNDQTYANFQSNGNGGADFQSTTVDQKNRMITKC